MLLRTKHLEIYKGHDLSPLIGTKDKNRKHLAINVLFLNPKNPQNLPISQNSRQGPKHLPELS